MYVWHILRTCLQIYRACKHTLKYVVHILSIAENLFLWTGGHACRRVSYQSQHVTILGPSAYALCINVAAARCASIIHFSALGNLVVYTLCYLKNEDYMQEMMHASLENNVEGGRCLYCSTTCMEWSFYSLPNSTISVVKTLDHWHA